MVIINTIINTKNDMQERPIDEIQSMIIDFVSSHPGCHVKDVLEKLRGNKNRVIEVKKQLVKMGNLREEKDSSDKRIIRLFVQTSSLTLNIKSVMSSLPLAEKRVNEYLKKLEKPLFIPIKIKDGETHPLKLKPKNKKNLDQILVTVNDLVYRTVALTYAECLDYIPKENMKEIKKFYQDCIITIHKIMNTVKKQHKESELELSAYLYYHVSGYSHFTTLQHYGRK